MHKNAEILKAIADGLPLYKVQVKDQFSKEGDIWQDLSSFSTSAKNSYMAYLVSSADIEFRIKPEPKPDIVRFIGVDITCVMFHGKQLMGSNVVATFDGDTGALKSIGMLKK